MQRRLCLGVSSLLLCACAAPPPRVLERPATPSALVADSASGVSGGGAFFYVAQAGGKAVADNNLSLSLISSRGQGRNMRIQGTARYLPAGATTLKLVGRVAYAAPIETLFRASYAVEGTVDVQLRDDARYRVVGVLDDFRREVWLEDEATGAVVGRKVVQLADSATIPADAAYTCCNLHHDGDWISDANWGAMPMIPAGSRIVVKRYGKDRAFVEIEGRAMRIGVDYGIEQGTIQQLIGRLAVPADPRPAIAAFPKAAQQAIAAGKVSIGMTKEEVLVALGYPRADRTTSIDADAWTYWLRDEVEYELIWGADRRLRQLNAVSAVRQQVLIAD